MLRGNKSKRGFTLAELSLVVALIAVVAVMTVSFFTLMNRQTDYTKQKHDMLSDIAGVQNVVKNWSKKYDSTDYSIEVEEGTDGRVIVAKKTSDGTEVARLYFSEDGKQLIFDDGNGETYYELGSLTHGKFSFERESGTGQKLFSCEFENEAVKSDDLSNKFIFTTNCSDPESNMLILDTNLNFLAAYKTSGSITTNGGGAFTGNDSEAADPLRNVTSDYSDDTVKKIVFDYASKHADIVNAFERRNILPIGNADREKIAAYMDESNDTMYILTEGRIDVYATNMARVFFGFNALETIENHNFYTEYVENWLKAFEATSVRDTDFLSQSPWKMRNVTSVQYMFINCKSLEHARMSFTSSQGGCTMDAMFCGCTKLQDVDLSGSRIIIGEKGSYSGNGMQYIFGNCSTLTSVIFPTNDNIDTSLNATYWRLFYNCQSLSNITNLDSLTNESTASYIGMFYNCSSLQAIDLRGFIPVGNNDRYWNGLEVNMSCNGMFNGCSNLEHIYVNNSNPFSLKPVHNGQNGQPKIKSDCANVFVGCKKLVSGSFNYTAYLTQMDSNNIDYDYVFGHSGENGFFTKVNL